MTTVWTIGHSTRSADDVVAVLKADGIDVIADVRRFPGSRRHPHFCGPALQERLARTASTTRGRWAAALSRAGAVTTGRWWGRRWNWCACVARRSASTFRPAPPPRCFEGTADHGGRMQGAVTTAAGQRKPFTAARA